MKLKEDMIQSIVDSWVSNIGDGTFAELEDLIESNFEETGEETSEDELYSIHDKILSTIALQLQKGVNDNESNSPTT